MDERELEIAMAEEHYCGVEITMAEQHHSDIEALAAPQSANEAPLTQTGDAPGATVPEEHNMADDDKKYRATGYFFTFSRSHSGGKQPEDMTREEAFNHIKKCYDEVRFRLH